MKIQYRLKFSHPSSRPIFANHSSTICPPGIKNKQSAATLSHFRSRSIVMFLLSSIINVFLLRNTQNSPQQSRRKSMPILKSLLFEWSISETISFLVLCSLVTADADDASELLSRPRWFNGDASFGSECGSAGILTTTDFPFWFTIWVSFTRGDFSLKLFKHLIRTTTLIQVKIWETRKTFV